MLLHQDDNFEKTNAPPQDNNNKPSVAFDEVEAACMLEELQVAIRREITAVKLPMLQVANTEWL